MNWKIFITSVRIWIRALFINAFLFFAYATITESFWAGLMVSALCFGGGIIVTAPLLVIVYPLVAYSLHIPYSVQAQVAWLAFSLATIVVSLFFAIAALAGAQPWIDSEFQLFLTSIFASIVFSVPFSRARFRKLAAPL